MTSQSGGARTVDNDCGTNTADSFNRKFSSSDSILIHHNIRSFNRNLDSMSIFLKSVDAKIPPYVLTETWFKRKATFNMDGYNSYHSFR